VGCTIAAAHTDSPSLKLKPQPSYGSAGMQMLAVEPYGGPLLNSWLNRDLGIAGRVIYRRGAEPLTSALVRIDDSPVTIPQLAIHLDRQVNESGLLLNKQNHLVPLASLNEGLSAPYLEELLKRYLSFDKLLAHDLFLFPLEPARHIGRDGEMLASYRLDNLSSVFAAASALAAIEQPARHQMPLAVFWDHEEVGSASAYGAQSPFLLHLLERISLALGLQRADFLQLLQQSFCLSIDMAHALHPNYLDRHDPLHQPRLNGGIVLKSNAQQRYATEAELAARIVDRCNQLAIPLQYFVSRNDMPCGSTIGPINGATTGIPTVDLGIPQLSMHSARELIGTSDQLQLELLLRSLFTG
jgi:aspartyl aminopeptidase